MWFNGGFRKIFCFFADKIELVHAAFLLLGSNLGNKLNWLTIATQFIEEEIGSIEKISSVYETEAWGNTNQDSFYNLLVIVKTTLSPLMLLKATQKIEQACDRKRIEHWGPRTMDIDIIFYDDIIFHQQQLIIPHPLICSRRFVLEPLVEIAPNKIHPELQVDITSLLQLTKDSSSVLNLGALERL